MKSLSSRINEALNEAKLSFDDILVELDIAGFKTSKSGKTFTAKKGKNTIVLSNPTKGSVDATINGEESKGIGFDDLLDAIAEWLQVNEDARFDAYMQKALDSSATIEYAIFVKIIGIAVQINPDAFKAYTRTFTSIQQLLAHLKSLYITTGADRKQFNQMLMDEADINYETMINEAKSPELKKDESYLVTWGNAEAYMQYLGKKGGKHQFDNSGKVIELTPNEVLVAVTNENLNESK